MPFTMSCRWVIGPVRLGDVIFYEGGGDPAVVGEVGVTVWV